MSSKRSKRNTKNFKKLKRTQRQDMRAGGRVGKRNGGYGDYDPRGNRSGPGPSQVTIPADVQKKQAPAKRPRPKAQPMLARKLQPVDPQQGRGAP